jgi:hypothetical protein
MKPKSKTHNELDGICCWCGEKSRLQFMQGWFPLDVDFTGEVEYREACGQHRIELLSWYWFGEKGEIHE